MTVSLKPRKKPRQRRSKVTCDAILEAAARILETEGPRNLTTNRIAENAGVSVGSLYQYFPSKEAILAELVMALRLSLLTDMEEAARGCAGMDLVTAHETLVRASLKHHARRPELARALESAEMDLPLNEDFAKIKKKLADVVAKVLKDHDIENAEQTAFDLISLSHGLATAAFQAGETDLDSLSNRLNRAVGGYLGLPRPSA